MFTMSQQFVLLLLLSSFRFMLADIFDEKLTPEENQSLADSALVAAIDDINDDEIFRQYNTKPYYQHYPYVQQDQQNFDHPPKQQSLDRNEHLSSYQEPPSSSFFNEFDQPTYFPFYHDNHRATVEVVTPSIDEDLSHHNDNRATVEVIKSGSLHDKKFDSIVEYLLEKLEREDQQIINGIYGMLFDSDHKTRPLENTTNESVSINHDPSKCDICKKNLKEQNQ